MTHLPGRNAPALVQEKDVNGVLNDTSALPGIRMPIKITSPEVMLFSEYIYSICGIHIEACKSYLLETRLGKLLESENCRSFSEFYRRIRNDANNCMQNKVIDAITTNETFFFRDSTPFELLKFKILPEVIDRSAKLHAPPLPIRIWSAACSTGQEVYSIAMIIKELLGDLSKYCIKLLGTDLSDAAIKKASYGAYNSFEIERGLSRDRLQCNFETFGSCWKIKSEIRSMVHFSKLNLMQSFSSLGKFDIIFCRNVAIYFKLEDRKKLFDRIGENLERDGFLVVGATESLTGICPQFIPKCHLNSIFYQLR